MRDDFHESSEFEDLTKFLRKALTKRQRKIIESGSLVCERLDQSLGSNIGFYSAAEKQTKHRSYVAYVPCMMLSLLIAFNVNAFFNAEMTQANSNETVLKT